MIRIGTIITVLGILCFIATIGTCAQQFVPGEILVKFRHGTPPSEIASIHRLNGSVVRGMIPGIETFRVSAPVGKEYEHAKKYKGWKCVEFAEPNYIASVNEIIPLDPYFESGQWTLKSVHAPEAWELSQGERSVIVAVIDTGVDYTHPDLAPRITSGYDFVNRDSDPMDDHGHGTAVAGIIGACTNNGIGVAGLTWYPAIMPIKVADSSGSASYSAIASGITYAADHGARVANISIAGSSASLTLTSAVDYAYQHGCLVVAASGNSAVGTVYYPAACANAVAVGACDQYGNLCSYSNYGAALDFVAPSGGYTTSKGGGYGAFGGTSAASPIGAGVAALIISANPSYTCSQVFDILKKGADDLYTVGWDEKSGWGRFNAYRSLALVTTPIVDCIPPTVCITSPANGATISDIVTVSADASDDFGVSRVEFYLDGAFVATAYGPYTWVWDTKSCADGQHTLVAKAYDAYNNAGVSSNVGVTVRNCTTSTQIFSGSVSSKSCASHQWSCNSVVDLNAVLTWNGSAKLELRLFNSRGEIIASTIGGTSPASLVVPALPAGNYRFEISTSSGKAKYKLTVNSTGR